MAYLIFLKDSEGAENTLYRIAENQSDLNNLNINANSVKIIEDSQDNFNAIKYKTKHAFKYNNNIITYVDSENLYIEDGYNSEENDSEDNSTIENNNEKLTREQILQNYYKAQIGQNNSPFII